MKRSRTTFLACFLILGITLPLCSCNNTMQAVKNDYVTRGAWMEMLASSFGMSDYISDVPVFEDVPQTNSYFPYVQSAFERGLITVEWGLLTVKERRFWPNSIASKEFVVTTAVKAIGVDFGEDIIEYAITSGIISDDKNLKRGLSQEDCVKIVQAAVGLYQEKDVNTFENIQQKDTIADISQVSAELIVSEGDMTTFKSEIG